MLKCNYVLAGSFSDLTNYSFGETSKLLSTLSNCDGIFQLFRDFLETETHSKRLIPTKAIASNHSSILPELVIEVLLPINHAINAIPNMRFILIAPPKPSPFALGWYRCTSKAIPIPTITAPRIIG